MAAYKAKQLKKKLLQEKKKADKLAQQLARKTPRKFQKPQPTARKRLRV